MLMAWNIIIQPLCFSLTLIQAAVKALLTHSLLIQGECYSVISLWTAYHGRNSINCLPESVLFPSFILEFGCSHIKSEQ